MVESGKMDGSKPGESRITLATLRSIAQVKERYRGRDSHSEEREHKPLCLHNSEKRNHELFQPW